MVKPVHEAFLQARAKKDGSKYLALVAAHAAADPFSKVIRYFEDTVYPFLESDTLFLIGCFVLCLVV